MGEARSIAFDTHGGRRSVTSRSLETALTDALRRHALSLQFQPQFDLRTGKGRGVEALARWKLSSGESIAPSVFIPIAERTGMIHELGAFVLESACAAVNGWCARGAQRLTLSVNVSALQVRADFSSVIRECLAHTGFPAQQLELEITESALIRDTDLTVERLTQWKEMGLRIALDDFGTGYSSLNYLCRLPVDRLKLDRLLVQRATFDKRSAIVLRSITALGADLGMEVIAEGVETEQQLQMLMNLGCPQAQGYLLGRPMTARQAQHTLRRAWGNRRATALCSILRRPSESSTGWRASSAVRSRASSAVRS